MTLCTHFKHLPSSSKPLRHVRVRILGPLFIIIITVPAEAHGHVVVHVERWGSGRVELDDGREAEFAPACGGQMHFKALRIQTPANLTFCLETKTCCSRDRRNYSYSSTYMIENDCDGNIYIVRQTLSLSLTVKI